MEPNHALTGKTLSELEELCLKFAEPKYRARQILDWVYRKLADSFEEMTNLPLESRRSALGGVKKFIISSSRIKQILTAQDGTRKILIELLDKYCIESVLISEPERITLCISTQVGCPIRCNFCASGRKGLIRSLQANEIVEQVLLAQRLLKPEKHKINNIVIMGMGEPLLNYENLMKALTIITAEWGLGIGTNRITVSTVGLPDQIDRLAKEKITPNLAISLHASNDATRRKIIPRAKRQPPDITSGDKLRPDQIGTNLISIKDLMKAAGNYHRSTGKDVTIEYLLIDGLNSEDSSAQEFASLLKSYPFGSPKGRDKKSSFKINLILYNQVPNLSYRSPSMETAERFQNILRENGLMAFIRKSKGQDIEAACGQLALKN
ncbi:MAG: 23S rRNA (adenine(2503)-C(2))-methyltransferase RlmN [Planctomycetota bacterium]